MSKDTGKNTKAVEASKPTETVDTATGEIVSSEPAKKSVTKYKVMNGVEYLNKLTAKSVMGDDFMETRPDKEEDLYTLIGLVQKAELNTKSQFGDSYKLKGSFKAIRAHDKKEFTSGALYLPHALEDIVVGQIQTAQSNGEDDVQFVVVIGRKPSKKGSVGYEYTYKPVLQVVQYDPLEALETAAKQALLLAAPQGTFTPAQLESFKK